MIAWLVKQLLALATSRNLTSLAWRVYKALSDQEVDTDYKLAMKEIADLEARLDKTNKEAKAHERMNDAELGIGAADSGDFDRLRDLASRLGKR